MYECVCVYVCMYVVAYVYTVFCVFVIAYMYVCTVVKHVDASGHTYWNNTCNNYTQYSFTD